MVIVYDIDDDMRYQAGLRNSKKQHLYTTVRYVTSKLQDKERDVRCGLNGKPKSTLWGGLDADHNPKADSFEEAKDMVKRQRKQRRQRQAPAAAPPPPPAAPAPAAQEGSKKKHKRRRIQDENVKRLRNIKKFSRAQKKKGTPEMREMMKNATPEVRAMKKKS